MVCLDRRVEGSLSVEQRIGLRAMKEPPAGKRWEDFRGRPLSPNIQNRLTGLPLRISEVIDRGLRAMCGIIVPSISQTFEISKPNMITTDALPFYISEKTVTVGLYRQFVEEVGYPADRAYSNMALSVLNNPRMTDGAFGLATYDDATAFARWYSEKSGQNFRLPTSHEWKTARELLDAQLAGYSSDSSEWTQGHNAPTLRLFSNGDVYNFYPDMNFEQLGEIRLIQEKQ